METDAGEGRLGLSAGRAASFNAAIILVRRFRGVKIEIMPVGRRVSGLTLPSAPGRIGVPENGLPGTLEARRPQGRGS